MRKIQDLYWSESINDKQNALFFILLESTYVGVPEKAKQDSRSGWLIPHLQCFLQAGNRIQRNLNFSELDNGHRNVHNE